MIEAVGKVAKVGLSLKPNNHNQVKVVQISEQTFKILYQILVHVCNNHLMDNIAFSDVKVKLSNFRSIFCPTSPDSSSVVHEKVCNH